MEFHRWLVVALVALLALPLLCLRPPATAQQAVARQIAFAAEEPALPFSSGVSVASARTYRYDAPAIVRPRSDLGRGERQVLRRGSPGLAQHVQAARIGADGIARRIKAQHRVVRSAVPAIVAVGTAEVHLLLRGGVRYRYLRRLRLVATAYNASYAQNGPWGPVAALNGMPLVKGMVAVDPSVIALGTRLYVEGYGPALAADTGSAIVGDRIDLFYNLDAQQTAAFGIKKVNVYILGPETLPQATAAAKGSV